MKVQEQKRIVLVQQAECPVTTVEVVTNTVFINRFANNQKHQQSSHQYRKLESNHKK